MNRFALERRGILENDPRATFAVLDRAGHFLGMAEQSRLVSALIVEWLERVELERAESKIMS